MWICLDLGVICDVFDYNDVIMPMSMPMVVLKNDHVFVDFVVMFIYFYVIIMLLSMPMIAFLFYFW